MSNFMNERGISNETLKLFRAVEGGLTKGSRKTGMWYQVTGTDGTSAWRWKRNLESANSNLPKYAWGCEKCLKRGGHSDKVIFMDDGKLGSRIAANGSQRLYLVGGDADVMLALSITENKLPVTGLFGEAAVTGLKLAFDVWMLHGVTEIWMSADNDDTGTRSIANVLWLCVKNNITLYVLQWPNDSIAGFDLCKFHAGNEFDETKTRDYLLTTGNYRQARFRRQAGKREGFVSIDADLVSTMLKEPVTAEAIRQPNENIVPDDLFLRYINDVVIPAFGPGVKRGQHVRHHCPFSELHNNGDKNPSLRIDVNRAKMPMIYCSCGAPTSVRGLRKQWELYADRMNCESYHDYRVRMGFAKRIVSLKKSLKGHEREKPNRQERKNKNPKIVTIGKRKKNATE